jgi:hypothetical protein
MLTVAVTGCEIRLPGVIVVVTLTFKTEPLKSTLGSQKRPGPEHEL